MLLARYITIYDSCIVILHLTYAMPPPATGRYPKSNYFSSQGMSGPPAQKYRASTIELPVLSVLIYYLCISSPDAPELPALFRLHCLLGRVMSPHCPQDGAWSQWGPWETCKGPCGRQGVQIRQRTCTNPSPLQNGLPCVGDSLQQRVCVVPGKLISIITYLFVFTNYLLPPST